MQILTLLSIFIVLATSQISHASGCGFYGNLRTVVSNDVVNEEHPDNNYVILSKTEQSVSIKNKVSGKVIKLGWEKTEKDEGSYTQQILQEKDVLFEEGNGCGPIYRCVTGQIVLQFFDSTAQKVVTYSYPTVLNTSTNKDIKYVSESLIPVFGALKLDVPVVGDDNASVDAQQCGYGNW